MKIPKDFSQIYTTQEQAKQINNIISYYVDNNSVITDATAGIGGNSLFFCKKFKFVNIVEKNYELEDILKENINYTNNRFIFCSYNYIKYILKQDVIFIDPPWGGSQYKKNKKISLYLDDVEITKLINDLYFYTKIICVKVPNNYNIFDLNRDFWNFRIYNIHKFNNKKSKQIYKILIFYKPV